MKPSIALIASVAALATTPALARPMTPEDVSRIADVGAFAVSSDGARIAFGRNQLPDIIAGDDNGTTDTSLHVVSAANSAQEFLPDGMDVSGIRFSPDGRMVSFLWNDDGDDDSHTALYGIPVAGGGHRLLAEIDGANIRSYEWAPDSRSVYAIAAAETDAQRAAESAAGFNAVIYQEEQRFNRIFAVTIGSEADPREIAVDGHVTQLRVSPDDDWLALRWSPTTLVDDSYTRQRVVIVDADDGAIRATVETPGKIGDYEISPDGSQLSLIAGIDQHDPAATTLHLVDAATGSYSAVNAGAAEAIVDTEWMADGRLAAVVHVGAQSELRFYDASGAVTAAVDPGAVILRRLDAAGDRLAAVGDAPSHPNELFLLNGTSFARWTTLNPWLADIDMGAQRTMTYQARDGLTVEGIVIEPVGGAPNGGAPTILTVHGGPEAHYSNGWLTRYSMAGQVGAGSGYAVFYPNYRGSTAYGTDFSKLHQSDYAGGEFNDLVDGIQALGAEGLVDLERVGITGGSYGGYASAWGATALTEHFAASVMFVGISNQISKFGTGDIPQEMYLVHARAWPWDDWQAMLEVSPIFHAGQSQTPTLILHGEEDTRVDPGQSYELYNALNIRTDVPVRLVLYPGEGHGNRNAAARYDYNIRLMRWMGHYLTGPGGEPPEPRIELPDGMIGGDASE
ncbi:S9 family peptidase [Parasphingopyxis sp. CP4]|uniref:S9 family peptidase n=1 Tax=Parasphingopyxis sp. CP4 TaxID=2724527 RepID=UPI0021024365|nr:S9 family peptidase [Parasphingopyxis sp. CP4]